MPITTTSTLPSPVQLWFDRVILSTPTPNLIHMIAAGRRRMPRNSGTTMRFRRYNALTPSMVPLGNSGAPIPAQNLTAVDIDAKINVYGTYLWINEQVALGVS